MPTKDSRIGLGSYYIPSGIWTPTIRKGPIAAEFVNAGPGTFNIRSTFGTGPSHTFGYRRSLILLDDTPGPGQYEIKNDITKDGKQYSQAAFMSPRLESTPAFITPAPGTYNPERAFSQTKHQPPSYTFGFRREDNQTDNYPSPCTYTTDRSWSLISPHSPDFTIGIRRDDYSKENTPAPGAYNLPEIYSYKHQREPAYTFGSKFDLPSDKTPKPSPADYYHEKVWFHKISPPRYTFGMRHSPYVYIKE